MAVVGIHPTPHQILQQRARHLARLGRKRFSRKNAGNHHIGRVKILEFPLQCFQNMKKNISIWLITLSFLAFGFGQNPKVKIKDLQILTGAQWTGTLLYLDYGSGKTVSIPSNLTVTSSKEDKSTWVFEYQYPDEPKANSMETLAISTDGKMFDDATVVEKTNLAEKTIKIVTEKSGTDNDQKALFRFTYLLSKTSFSIKKEVKYDDAPAFFVRNEYLWKR